MNKFKISGTVKKVESMTGSIAVAQGGSGTNDYEKLINKPKINEIELIGDKSFNDLGLKPLTNIEIAKMFN